LSPRVAISLGAFFAALSVAIGAFGAHWLKQQVPVWYPEPAAQAHMLDTWEVGVRYQMYSAIGMIVAGLCARMRPGRTLAAANGLFIVAIVVFSGLLYGRVLLDQKFLGAIVFIGGFAMILAWLLIAWAAWPREVTDGRDAEKR
jgi:uncharacterized membrane protein YgdD (TMEM256/DUF423 family)